VSFTLGSTKPPRHRPGLVVVRGSRANVRDPETPADQGEAIVLDARTAAACSPECFMRWRQRAKGAVCLGVRRRLPMVEVAASTPVVGAHGEVPLIDVVEGRGQLFASYLMWYDGASAAHQCEGCTMNIGHVLELMGSSYAMLDMTVYGR
jgi:Bacterial protein of unknown function (DUF899)